MELQPSDSTGGLSASQEGMRSPIVQDTVVDAVLEARSKLANLASRGGSAAGTVPNSLASYAQNHNRWGACPDVLFFFLSSSTILSALLYIDFV